MNEILDLNVKELETVVLDMGESKFRAKQLFEWFHNKKVWNYDDMTNLSVSLRNKLKQTWPIMPLEIVEKLESKLDGTIKYLFRLPENPQ